MFPYEVFLLCASENFLLKCAYSKKPPLPWKILCCALTKPPKAFVSQLWFSDNFWNFLSFSKNPSCAPIRYYLKVESFLQLYILGTLNFLQIHLWLQKCFLLNTFHVGLISWYWSLQRLNNVWTIFGLS